MAPGGAAAEGPGAIAVGGDASGSLLVTGDNNTFRLDFGGREGDLLTLLQRGLAVPTKQPRPVPVRARPPAFADHLDRVDEATSLLGRAAPGAPVNVYGDDGVGKTYLMAHAAHDPRAEARDGVVHLDGRGLGRQDLLQQLYEELFDCQPPAVQQEAQVRRDIRDKAVLVLVDSFELDRDEAQRLFAAAPGCRFAVASTARAVWEGTPLRLGGLPLPDAMAIVERELGPLAGAELAAAESVCTSLGGNALAIRQAASVARDDGIPLAEVAGWLTGATPGRDGLVERTLGAVTHDEREVLATLAILGSAPLATEHLAGVTNVADVQATLSSLERRRLVASHSPRYSLRGVTADEVQHRWPEEVEARTGRVVRHLAGWVVERRDDLPRLLVQSEALLAALRTSARHRWDDQAVALGRALSTALTFGRRWGRWREVLETVLEVGRRHDPVTESWALHQLGTRAAALGLPEGVGLLREALALREAGDDQTAAAVTRHNLEVALAMGAPPPRPPRRLRLRLLIGGLLVAVVALGVAFLALRPASASLDVATTGPGTVTSASGGIDCGRACRASVRQGSSVTLTATAARGAVFVGWTGACTGTGSCTPEVRGDTSVRAVFEAAPVARALTVTPSRRGTVTSTPSGIGCGQSCTASFANGARVTLRAAAAEGSVFAGWRGGGCSGTGPCTVVLRSDTTVTATFETPATTTHVLTARTSGEGGTVTSEPSGIDCGGSCEASFAEGTTVTLTATAAQGSGFVGWRGACTKDGPCSVTMSEDRAVTAVFQEDTRTLTVIRARGAGTAVTRYAADDSSAVVKVKVGGASTCPKACTVRLARDEEVTLVAEGSSSFDSTTTFLDWEAPCQEGRRGPTCTVRLVDDLTVTAIFTVSVN